MNLQTFILIGRPGCGKGTQAELLQKYIKENDKEARPVFYLESGQKFREFIEEPSFTARKAKEIQVSGGLQPSFLAVHLWSHIMIENMTGSEHLVIDGTPRKVAECLALDSAMKFYDRKNPTILYLNVSEKWSFDRLSGRGRTDDQGIERITRRLKLFETDIVPTLEHLKQNKDYRFIDINGEQSVEDVQKEILSKIFIK